MFTPFTLSSSEYEYYIYKEITTVHKEDSITLTLEKVVQEALQPDVKLY